jgi:Tfp pilus assembly protein PilX
MSTYQFAPNTVSHPVSRTFPPPAKKASERGVALVITLLLLSMVIALSVGMVIAMSSETLIGGYYRNFRGSFYAADSGLNVGVQQIESQLQAAVPTTFAVPPIANQATLGTNVLASLNSSYGNSTSLNVGDASSSWKESFKLTGGTLTTHAGSPQITSYNTSTGSCTAAAPCPNGYAYIWDYNLTSVGSSQGSETQTVTESGTITLNITGLAATNSVSFAYFGAFIDYYQGGIGPLVPGTMTGPMFTNTAWEFMPSIAPWTAPYIFTDPVGQVQSQVYYWNTSWGYNLSSASSYGSGANLVAPQFQQGLQLNQNPVPLPTNSFNQEEAVIDGFGNEMTQAQTTAALSGLQNLSGASHTGSTTSGVFMNKGTSAAACGAKTTPCIAGGGFYVEGAANVQLIPGSGSTAQIYMITQGNTTTTITVDPAANGGAGTTVITQGSTTQTLNGVPMDYVTGQAGTVVYVDGTMTIQGPGEGKGAVQDNAMINLTANGDIIATGDVLYKTEPVSIPQDALIPSATNMNQVLGLYTATGNFITQDTQADQNIEVDGSIATISTADSANNCASGKGGQLSYGHINTFNNVGGMIQSCIYAADVDTENTWFDRRFTARPNFAPPWFPSTQITLGGPLPTNTKPSVQRLQWLSTSAQ